MKRLLQNIAAWIGKLFHNVLPSVQKAVEIGVTVTEAIKNFDTSNPAVADIITQLIPGTVDDDIKLKIRDALPKIILELKLVDATFSAKTPDEILIAAMNALKQMDGDYSNVFLHNLSMMISSVASDGKLSWSDAILICEWFYQNKVKK